MQLECFVRSFTKEEAFAQKLSQAKVRDYAKKQKKNKTKDKIKNWNQHMQSYPNLHFRKFIFLPTGKNQHMQPELRAELELNNIIPKET